MFIGDFEKVATWSDEAVKGSKRFLDRCWNFTRFTVTKTNATVTIAYYSQSCEGENTTTFNGFRYAVYRDQLFLQFASLFFDVSHLTPLP